MRFVSEMSMSAINHSMASKFNQHGGRESKNANVLGCFSLLDS